MKLELRKFTKIISKFICIAIVIYCSIFVNITNVYAKTTENNNIETSSDEYVLTLEERGNIEEKIKASDINLKYSYENSKGVYYDENLLKELINKLDCFDESKIIESKNPKIVYLNDNYVVRKEIYGNRVNKEILYNNIVNAINNDITTLNLEKVGSYEDPIYTSTSSAVIQACEDLNKYISTRITYKYGGNSQVLDGFIIKNWIYIDGDYKITILEDKVRQYLDNMAREYTNSLGKTTPVSGGDSGNNHGWKIDSSIETASLIETIKRGQTINKYPAYSKTPSFNYLSSLGDTYVEIDMSNQYLWFYKNGYIVTEGNIVTGNLSAGCGTPVGVYKLNNKQKDTSLVGQNYNCPVSFWMPFIGNSIGLHDAGWRWEFGGDIYKQNGSHGCINLPYTVAKSIYNNINIGTTIVCHY